MKRSEFRNLILGVCGIFMLTGCKSRIAKSARNPEAGDPFRCNRCGYLFRSTKDMSNERCPRCYATELMRISEEEMETYLKAD